MDDIIAGIAFFVLLGIFYYCATLVHKNPKILKKMAEEIERDKEKKHMDKMEEAKRRQEWRELLGKAKKTPTKPQTMYSNNYPGDPGDKQESGGFLKGIGLLIFIAAGIFVIVLILNS